MMASITLLTREKVAELALANDPTALREHALALASDWLILEARVQLLEKPTIWWLANAPEQGESDLFELMVDHPIGEVARLTCAHDLGHREYFGVVLPDPNDPDCTIVQVYPSAELASEAAAKATQAVAHV